jgi:DNA-binding transcriptional MerR regulator
MSVYKIKDLEVLSGIKAHTIRIWEKRYGILNPERSDSKIRAYNNDELTHLMNLSLLNKNGYKISHLAILSFDEIKELVWKIRHDLKLDNSQEKLISALISLDEELFRDTLGHLIDTIGLEKTFSEHLIPFLDRIGVMWLVGTIHAAQEHFISNLIRQKIIVEINNQEIPKVTTDPILLYLPEHEWHEISLLFYQYLLRSKGIHTVYIGQSLPYSSLQTCLEILKPKAILTSWLTCVEDSFMKSYFKQLHKDVGGIPIMAGGAQVNLNSKLIKEYIVEIKSSSSLLSHFNV